MNLELGAGTVRGHNGILKLVQLPPLPYHHRLDQHRQKEEHEGKNI
jgi:hypothetical protein